MSNYIKGTNFTVKDTLPSGNASKIIRGAEIDDELTAIASAVSSKADSSNSTLTGTTSVVALTISGAVTGTIDGGTY
jgi:hypothetical protein